jgi:membrane associated rhomboid family serine protease
MTILIIIITSIVSVLAFYDHSIFAKLQFNAYQIVHRKEIHRLVTHGFIHANWGHLIVNMFVLYFFGTNAENIIYALADAGLVKYPIFLYFLFYFLAIIFSASISLYKHRNNYLYNSVGASGATSSMLMFSIFFNPWETVYVYFIPVYGIIFAVLYIIYSQYMAKRGGDNIAHDAHLLGSVFGFVFPLFINLNLIKYFIESLKNFPL